MNTPNRTSITTPTAQLSSCALSGSPAPTSTEGATALCSDQTPTEKRLTTQSDTPSSLMVKHPLSRRDICHICSEAMSSRAKLIDDRGAYSKVVEVKGPAPENKKYAVKVSRQGRVHYQVNLLEAQRCLNWTHTNLVESLGCGTRKGETICLIMTRYPETLADRIHKNRRSLSESVTRNITLGIIEGLIYLHDIGYLHGDLKPNNILLHRDGTPKLTDFGLSCRIDEPDYIDGPCFYMAPELSGYCEYEQKKTDGSQLTVSSEIFGLGFVLFNLHTKQIFINCWEVKGGCANYILQIPHRCRDLTSRPIYTEVIHPAMSLNPKNRPPSMKAIKSLALGKMKTSDEAETHAAQKKETASSS